MHTIFMRKQVQLVGVSSLEILCMFACQIHECPRQMCGGDLDKSVSMGGALRNAACCLFAWTSARDGVCNAGHGCSAGERRTRSMYMVHGTGG